MPNAVDRLRNYLSRLGNVKEIYLFDDSQDRVDFFGVRFVTRIDRAQDLEGEINRHLSKETGYLARVRFIEYKDLSNNKMEYVVEIAPDKSVPRKKWKDATESFVSSLPKVIDNFRMKHRDERKNR